MQLRWTPAAVADLSTSVTTLGSTIHVTASRPSASCMTAVVGLKKWPERGRIGREEGTREFLFSPLPYVVVYRLTERSVEVLRIYHTAQDRP